MISRFFRFISKKKLLEWGSRGRWFNSSPVSYTHLSGTATSYVTQPANYDWCNVERGGWLQYVIWAYNSYDIPSAWAVVEIQTKSGLINVYLADGWHTDCPVYINPIDKPPNTLIPADVIYVADNDGHWRPNV